MKKAAQKLGYAMLLYLAASLGVEIVIVMAIEMVAMVFAIINGGDLMEAVNVATSGWSLFATSVLSTYAAGPLAAWLIIRKMPVKVPERTKPAAKDVIMSAVAALGIFYAFGYISNVILWAVGSIFGMTAEQLNAVNMLGESFTLWQYIIMVCVCAPIVEELLFRKMVINRMLAYGKIPAIIFSAAVFGLVHGTLSQIPYALALGAVLGYIYIRFGNIYLNIGLHMLMNFMGGVIYEIIGDSDVITYVDLALTVILVIAAIVIIIIKFKSIKSFLIEDKAAEADEDILTAEEKSMSNAERVKTVLLNPGFILFAVFCLVIMLLNLVVMIVGMLA